MRIFGKSDGLLNREVENVIFKHLSEKSISPKIIGIYPWGRLEEFLVDSKPLSSGMDMVHVSDDVDCVDLIAKSLRSLHSVKLDLGTVSASANIFEILQKWLSLASKYAVSPSVETLQKEINFINHELREKLLNHPRVKASVLCARILREVLCHNDMLAGNIMMHERDKTVRLIDFEYAGLNHAVADIANVFTAVCESQMLAGQPQDVVRNFPSEAIQKHFLESYFGQAITDSGELALLLALVSGFAMADELRWTIWGIIQANQSTVDFDYVGYYHSRFSAYKDYVEMFKTRIAHNLL
jgi:thiamine kinase-like enzyme